MSGFRVQVWGLGFGFEREEAERAALAPPSPQVRPSGDGGGAVAERGGGQAEGSPDDSSEEGSSGDELPPHATQCQCKECRAGRNTALFQVLQVL